MLPPCRPHARAHGQLLCAIAQHGTCVPDLLHTMVANARGPGGRQGHRRQVLVGIPVLPAEPRAVGGSPRQFHARCAHRAELLSRYRNRSLLQRVTRGACESLASIIAGVSLIRPFKCLAK